MAEVKLFGFWASPFSVRVIWALKLKGVSFEYVEEDLQNKSSLLLQYNPVHKKIPVLLHNGKPIAESVVILEYIEETWPQNPILPTDPYERSSARFWAKFIDERTRPMWDFVRTVGEEQEREIKKNLEILKIIEEHGLGGDKKFFGGDKIGLADLVLGWIVDILPPQEDAVGVKFITAETFPRLHAWIKNFGEIPVIKDNLPDRDGVMNYIRKLRAEFVEAANENLQKRG